MINAPDKTAPAASRFSDPLLLLFRVLRFLRKKKKKKAREILFSTRKERIIAKHEDTKFTLHHGIPNSNTLLVRLDTRNTLGSHMGGGGIFLEEGSDDEKW